MSTSPTYNAIMEAGGKDHAPMLVSGSCVRCKSQIRRYIATRPNHDLINHCIDEGTYEFIMVTHPATKATETLATQDERMGLKTYSSVSKEKKKFINAEAEAEAVHIIFTGIDNNIYSTVDACPNAKET
ncbi:hypothetical protein Tco_0877656 [Tanacetum coccineum]|uniref:Uncharacterized protein n=1 Tax=Tanacetum coccineum TaxID=301880 RepID=A0ABQ5BVS9_9ASTR